MSSTTRNEWINGMTYIPFAIFNIALITIHSRKIYYDLYTKDRKSVAHKRILPQIDKPYKRMTWITLITIITFGLSPILAVYSYNFAFIQNRLTCTIGAVIVMIPWQLSKPLMYSVFLLRLHQVYGQSVYGYKKSTLWCLAITITTLYVSCAAPISVMMLINSLWIPDADDKYPFYCWAYGDEGDFIRIPLALMVLFDIILGIGAVVTFQLPINRLFKQMRKNDDTEDTKKKQGKMLYIGYKYKVLVACATTTTVIWILSAVLGAQPEAGGNVIATTVGALDFSVNMICLMLMTPYYPDDVYYQRLCGLCICICARRGELYESKATPETREKQTDSKNLSLTSGKLPSSSITSQSTAISVDTIDQIEIVAKSTNPDNLLTDVEEYSDEEVP